MSSGSAIPHIILVGAALLTIVGIVLLIMALFPRRKGKTPYCRRCGYDLSGAVSDVCSECGASLFKPRSVIFGRRQRRRGRIIGAACLTLAGLVPLVVMTIGVANGIVWYHYCPTWLVLQNVQSSNLQTCSRAYLELARRRTMGTFPAHKLDELAKICLAEQARVTPRGSISQLLVNELGTMHADGNLTTAQARRLLEKCIQNFTVRTRRPGVVGQCLPLTVEFDRRMPSTLHAAVVANSVRIDGEKVSDAGMGTGSGGWHDNERLGICTAMPPDIAAGRHTLEMDVRVEIIQLIPGNVDWDNFLYEDEQTISTSFELVAEEPADYVRLKRNPALDQTVTTAISLTFPSIADMGPNTAPQAQICVQFAKPMPIDIAFLLQLEANGQILATKEVTCPRNLPYAYGDCSHFPVESELPSLVDIRLIPDKAAAAKTVDMVEIWGGELLFEDVEVPYGRTTTMPHATYVPMLVPARQDDGAE